MIKTFSIFERREMNKKSSFISFLVMVSKFSMFVRDDIGKEKTKIKKK